MFSDGRANKLRVVKHKVWWTQPPRSWGFFRVKNTKLRGNLGLWLYFWYITLVEGVLKSGVLTLIMNWDDRISVCIKKLKVIIIIIIIINKIKKHLCCRAPGRVGPGSVTPLSEYNTSATKYLAVQLKIKGRAI